MNRVGKPSREHYRLGLFFELEVRWRLVSIDPIGNPLQKNRFLVG
jgi:hypothetical protein